MAAFSALAFLILELPQNKPFFKESAAYRRMKEMYSDVMFILIIVFAPVTFAASVIDLSRLIKVRIKRARVNRQIGNIGKELSKMAKSTKDEKTRDMLKEICEWFNENEK